MTKVPPVPYKSPLFGQNGQLLPVWADWFKFVLIRIGGSEALSNTELEAQTVSTALIEDNAVTAAKIAAAVAGNGLSGGGGSSFSVNVDGSTIEINADTLRVKDSGIPFVKLLSTDWTKSTSASGYYKLPNGMCFQWGVTGAVTSGSTHSVSLPTAFPTGLLQAMAGVRDNSAVATTSTGQWGTGNYSESGFDIYNRTSVSLTFNWFAVGY